MSWNYMISKKTPEFPFKMPAVYEFSLNIVCFYRISARKRMKFVHYLTFERKVMLFFRNGVSASIPN